MDVDGICCVSIIIADLRLVDVVGVKLMTMLWFEGRYFLKFLREQSGDKITQSETG